MTSAASGNLETFSQYILKLGHLYMPVSSNMPLNCSILALANSKATMGSFALSSCCEEIGARAVTKVYLMTYSNANTEVYDREKFSTLITKVFEEVCRDATVVQ